MKTSRFLLVISILIIFCAPFLMGAGFYQEEVPEVVEEGDVVNGGEEFLSSVGEWAAKIVAFVLIVAVVLFGTVQGLQLLKMVLPKVENELWLKIRKGVVTVLSMIVPIFAFIGLNFDISQYVESLSSFNFDPVILEILGGLALSRVGNAYYDKNLDEKAKKKRKLSP